MSLNQPSHVDALGIAQNGDPILVGAVHDGLVAARVAVNDGSIRWSRFLAESPIPSSSAPGGSDVLPQGDGDLIITGSMSGNPYIARLAGVNGALQWQLPLVSSDARGHVLEVFPAPDDGLLVRQSYSWGDKSDSVLANYDATEGHLRWRVNQGSSGGQSDQLSDRATGLPRRLLHLGRDGESYVVGRSHDGDRWQLAIWRFDADGNLTWSHYEPEGISATALAVSDQGALYVAGAASPISEWAPHDGLVQRHDALGEPVWQRRLPESFSIVDMATTSTGRLCVLSSGHVHQLDAGSGEVYWTRPLHEIDGSGHGGAAIAVDPSGDCFVAGAPWSEATIYDIAVSRFASAGGQLLWTRRYDGPGRGNDYTQALAIGADGDLMLGGTSRGLNGHDQFVVLRYARADGSLLWIARSNDVDQGYEYLSDLTIAANGDAVASGRFYQSGSGRAALVVRFAVADGSHRWRMLDGLGTDVERDATRVRSDARGDFWLAGHAVSAQGYSLYAAHIDGETGRLRASLQPDRVPISHRLVALDVNERGQVRVAGTLNSELGTRTGVVAWTDATLHEDGFESTIP